MFQREKRNGGLSVLFSVTKVNNKGIKTSNIILSRRGREVKSELS